MPPPLPVVDMGIKNPNMAFKRMFRFLFLIEGVSVYGGLSVKSPLKGQRPNFSFKEIALEHHSETIYMPGKIEWKPVQLTLYDTYNPQIQNDNPVYQWIRSFYYPNDGQYGYAAQNTQPSMEQFKKSAYINMYDGNGCLIESWWFQNAWPQEVNFNECDMGDSGVMTIDLTLRYDRALPY